jgi:MFS family permease
LLAVSATSLVGFVVAEALAPNPILSLGLFRNPTFTLVNAASFVTAMAFMGAVAFLPFYMQIGQGIKATLSGLSMLPMMLGMMLSSIAAGQVISRTGKYKALLVGGAGLLVLGLFAIAHVSATTTTPDLAWRLLLVGIGLGPGMSAYNSALQAAVETHQLGVATSSYQFFRQIGGTMGVALFGAILTHNFAEEANRAPPPRPGVQAHVLTLSDLQKMAVSSTAAAPGEMARPASAPPDRAIRAVVVRAITGVFTVAIGIALLGLLLVTQIPVLTLEKRSGP